MDAADRDDQAGSSTAELIGRATDQLSTLVRDELALARVELIARGKRAGLGGDLFGAAAALAMYGLGPILVLVVVLLHLVWPVWLAVLAVAVLVLAAALHGNSPRMSRHRVPASTVHVRASVEQQPGWDG